MFPLFLKGLGMTVAISGISLVTATCLGLVCGILKTSRFKTIRFVISVYVDVVRGTPFLVQVFVIFFILPEWGINMGPFTAALVAMTVMGGGFICEIIAAGVDSVDKGQREAALSTGLTAFQQLRFVIMPQAMRIILPPLVGQYVLLIKDSSIVSVIGVMDLTRAGWLTVQRIPEGVMVFGLVGLLYFAVCYPLIRLSNYLERRMRVDSVL